MTNIAFHNHSNYSYDGEITLQEWREYCLKRGIDVLILVEHDDDFDDEKMTRYIADCAEHSDDQLLIIPGIEYRMKHNIHLIALGTDQLIKADKEDPDSFFALSFKLGATTILAHPLSVSAEIRNTEYYQYIAENVAGIEIWNTRQDCRYFPDYRVLDFCAKMAQKRPKKPFFIGGMDVHDRSQLTLPQYVRNIAECSGQDEKSVLSFLTSNQYSICGRFIQLKSDFTCQPLGLRQFLGLLNAIRVLRSIIRFGEK